MTLNIVRVFVPTYRRPAFLARALRSLRAQTFKYWICEVHNDYPGDSFPAELIQRLSDSRIVLYQHQRNLGASETFNLFYRPTPEPFYCLLEDDNWWEPEFLNRMYSEMRLHPEVVLAWCNQKIWAEHADGSWRDTGRFVNSPEPTGTRLISFGDARQIMGALHSNGAILLRHRNHQTYTTPRSWPFAAVEPFRERMMPHPLLYIPEPLAVYSQTLQTARNNSRADWAVAQSFLAATFIKNRGPSSPSVVDLVAGARAKHPPETNVLIFSAIIEPSCRRILRYLKVRDWFLFLCGVVRRPRIFWRVLLSRRRHREWWQLLDHHTAERFNELRLPKMPRRRAEFRSRVPCYDAE